MSVGIPIKNEIKIKTISSRVIRSLLKSENTTRATPNTHTNKLKAETYIKKQTRKSKNVSHNVAE